MQAEHWSEARLFLEAVFVSGARLHTGAESRDSSSPCLETSPQPAVTQTICIHIQTDGDSGGGGKGKQSKAGSLVKEIIQTKGRTGTKPARMG